MSKLSRILGYALLIAVLPLVLQAQMGQGRGNGQGQGNNAANKAKQMNRMFDVNTVSTFEGVITEVVIDSSRNRNMTGIHLMVKTGDVVKEVHVGPVTFLNNQEMTFEEGDTIEITGSAVTLNSKDFVIAKSLNKGGKALQLRDDTGKPVWSGMMKKGKQNRNN
ncbi:MAG TPA: hypothetical protein DEQ34_10700 [Balneolaceae bacterium]|nr:hypothetical protein [Balneolaceae bacterium]|tara:strand:+ start:88793 stop:89284 length:492 start_codon:yes stop_codon:yes gene_type:complete